LAIPGFKFRDYTWGGRHGFRRFSGQRGGKREGEFKLTDYGTDFLLADDDLVFTPDGDIGLVSGAACVAQDTDRTLKTVPGPLYWDRDTGNALLYMLNAAGGADSESGADTVIAELERV
jgi:hypothetical protein